MDVPAQAEGEKICPSSAFLVYAVDCPSVGDNLDDAETMLSLYTSMAWPANCWVLGLALKTALLGLKF